MTTGDQPRSELLGRVAPRAPGRSSTDLPGNSHKVARHDRIAAAKAAYDLSEHIAKGPYPFFIGVNGAVEAFQFIDFRSFHGAASNEGAKPDHVA